MRAGAASAPAEAIRSRPPKPEGKINTTDPDARRMKFGRNFIPAYNAQAVVTEEPDHRRRRDHHRGRRLRAARPDGRRRRARARARRRRRAPRGRARRRRLLVERPHRRAAGARHDPDRRPRHDPQPTAKDPPRRALRLHAKSDRHRARWRALLEAVRWSSRSSPRSSRTGGSGASNEEAGRPPARNGA